LEIKKNNLIGDNKAQGAAELILLIGGMIIIVLIAIFIYKNYVSTLGEELNSNELKSLNSSIKNISVKFKS